MRNLNLRTIRRRRRHSYNYVTASKTQHTYFIVIHTRKVDNTHFEEIELPETVSKCVVSLNIVEIVSVFTK